MPDTTAPNAAADANVVEELRALLSDLAASPVSGWSMTAEDDPANASESGDAANWQEVTLPYNVSGSPVAWFRARVTTPSTHHGWSVEGAPLNLVLSVRHNADVYVNGRFLQRVQRGDRRVPLTRSARGGEAFDVALRVAGPGSRTVDTSEGSTGRSIGLNSAALESGALDSARAAILDHLDRMDVSSRLTRLAGQGATVLSQAARAIDRDAIARGDEAALLESIEAANETLTGLDDLFKRYTISLTGNAHIDMAWLWDREETKQVTHDTFRSVLNLMNEYDDFVFAQSQAHAYEWVEQYWPEMFEEIRQRVKEGRWEIVGGMWVEPDCNLPNGESFVRQVLYGKRYFQQKFGVDVTLGWNPDSFGYNWAMPQVYKKCGINAFLTQKLTWNDTNVWPHRAFWWESADGSRIFSYFPTDYVGHVLGPRLITDLAAFAGATGYKRTDHLYGIGDHGGGPTRDMLDRAKALAEKKPFPAIKHQSAREFIDTLIAESDDPGVNVPVWNSELYLEYHRGTFTSQAAIKKGNRVAERLLRDAETFGALAARHGHAYDQATMERLWKITLFNQFHDILPGSCIGAAAQDAWDDYAIIEKDGAAALDDALRVIASKLGKAGEGAAVTVFNGLNYDRQDVAAIPLADLGVAAEQATRVVGADGQPVLSQVVDQDGAPTLLFLASVPAIGAAVYTVSAGDAAAENTLSASESHIENANLRVEINPDGTFGRVYHKGANFEALAPGEAGNVLQAFVDNPGKWEAWEIDKDFEQDYEELRGPVEIEVLEAGPVRARVRTRRQWRSSVFVQDITLTANAERVDVATWADWHDRRTMLKVMFPVNVQAAEATYEVPYSAIARSTGNESSFEKAQFEVPALQWADLSDDQRGVALLNDSKHGHDIKGNRMRLTLLRGPISPDPKCDKGEHTFTYSLAPHAGGGFHAGGVYAEAYNLNNPLLARAFETGVDGPAQAGYLSIGGDNVMLSAVKKAEDSDDMIVRFFETAGQDGEATLTFAEAPSAAWETDMMENDLEAIAVSGNAITVPLGHNEVKTLKVRF